MKPATWGVIGPGAIARNFADGLSEARSGELVAIASLNGARRQAFGHDYGISTDKRYADYASLASDPYIQAIYIATPHIFHAELAIMAMRAGKAVLCEKPAGMTAAQVVAMTEVAAQQSTFFMEAVMYRCHPQIARMVEIIRSGEIGEISHIRAAFGFDASFDPTSRLFDRSIGGGAILDVGVYPASFARLVAGVAIGMPYDNPEMVKAVGRMGTSEVDEETYAILTFKSGIIAECAVATLRNMANTATIIGSKGQIHLPDPWVPGRNAGPSDAALHVTVGDQTRTEEIRRPEHLFAFEAELASRTIAEGRLEPEAPAMGWADSIGNAETLDRWRHEIGYIFTRQDTTVTRVLKDVIPAGVTRIPQQRIHGVERPVSSLVIGCDNKATPEDGCIVWDAWIEAGGNAFDTAFVYGNGRQEAALGTWIAARGVQKDIVVIAKGGHTPYCFPGALEVQLNMSLDRLGLDYVPIFIMHRDNPDVPVDEFVDALNRLHTAGRIGIFGGSNWSIERFVDANAYARMAELEPLRILNNNLSLAVMERPVWPGCVTSNTKDTLAFLQQNDVIHFSWSSQARGYFLPEALRHRLPEATAPDACFGSDANAERRRRAGTLADELGVSPHNIATAWVLTQSFPSFALIGPRSPGEIVSTLPSLDVDLSPAELAWLNLESESR